MNARNVEVLAAWIAGVVVAVGMMACRAPGASLSGHVAADADVPSLLLTEVTVRTLAPDVLSHMQANDARYAAVQVDWSEEAPAVQVRHERNDLVRIVLNSAFWREHERLIEATVFAAQLNVRKELRPFAIARAQQLRDNLPPTSRPVAETLWEELGFDAARFARLRERPDFQSRARALRHQALAWSLARAALRDLARTTDPQTTDIGRRAAEITFDLHCSPAPPLVRTVPNNALSAIALRACTARRARAQPHTCMSTISLRTMIGARIRAVVALLALLSSTAPVWATAPAACELLPPAVVSSALGEIVHVDSTASREHDAGGSACRYIGRDGVALAFSVLSMESEIAARHAFGQELTRVFGRAPQGELLRGVVAEARFGVSEHTRDNTIVARHGVSVFVLAGHADQVMLVSLARSVIARLERAEPG